MDGTYIHEKMLNINCHQGNTNAAMRYWNTPIKISKIKDVGLELSSAAGVNVKCVTTLENRLAGF